MDSYSPVVDKILKAPRKGRRRIVALAGAPASGKSTLAETLAHLLIQAGCQAQVVPMDGFHLHNDTLIRRGMLDRKGSPDTFDAVGFVHLVSRLSHEAEIFYPTFDRQRDIAIAGAGHVDGACDTVIIEGNYLLFDAPVWRELPKYWDLSIRLDVPVEVLLERLVERWTTHGLAPDEALARANGNDLANAQLISDAQLAADVTI